MSKPVSDSGDSGKPGFQQIVDGFLLQPGLPLPEDASDEERSEALRLMVAAQSRLRIDRADTAGANELREFALSLHTKHGTVPFWGQGD